MNKMLTVNNLTKTFGNIIAVNDISFSVNKGEIMGFLGPNGAGKTTAIRMIMGIIKADRGDINFYYNNKEQPEALNKHKIGYLPEEKGLYDDVKVMEKRNRIVELLLSSVSSLELMMGKIVGYGTLSLLQIIIWFTAGFLVASRFLDLGEIPLSFAEILPPLIFFIFGYIMIAALFAALGATMKEAEEGSQAQGLVIIIPMFPLFISSVIFMTPNVLWLRVLSHIPPFIPAMALLRMAATTLPMWEMITIFIALIISIILIVFAGARIFEKGILQYDSISLKEIKAMIFKN